MYIEKCRDWKLDFEKFITNERSLALATQITWWGWNYCIKFRWNFFLGWFHSFTPSKIHCVSSYLKKSAEQKSQWKNVQLFLCYPWRPCQWFNWNYFNWTWKVWYKKVFTMTKAQGVFSCYTKYQNLNTWWSNVQSKKNTSSKKSCLLCFRFELVRLETRCQMSFRCVCLLSSSFLFYYFIVRLEVS